MRNFLFLALSVALCALAWAAVRSQTDESTGGAGLSALKPYESGRWRLDPEGMDRVAFTLSHILVRHRGSDLDANTNFRGPDWHPEQPVMRTREEAAVAAIALAADVRANPAQFGEFARRSDDVVTRWSGGSLGTWTAPYLPETFLDALATMRTGDVSRVVETPLGFHILKLRAQTQRNTVSARRILIGYAETSSFVIRAGHDVTRSREEALSLAKGLAARAKEDPALFDALVQQHSDHPDAARKGDIGVWDTTQSFPWNREVELLSQMSLHQVSDPVDGMHGFNIFLRTQATQRPTYAIERIVLQAEPGEHRKLTGPALDRVHALARSMLDEITKTPARFADYQAQHCCVGVSQWSQGRGDAAIEAAVEGLEIGHTARHPIELGMGIIHLIRRVSPAPAPVEHVVDTALPAPQHANLAQLAELVESGEDLGAIVTQLVTKAESELGGSFEAVHKLRLWAVVDQLVIDLKAMPRERRKEALSLASGELSKALGADLYERLLASIDHVLMSPSTQR